MFEATKGFIEYYIDLIEQMDWRALFDFFYADELQNRYCEEIVLTLKKAFPEQAEAIKAAQESVFIEYFESALNSDDYGNQIQTILYRLPNYCGLQIRRIPKILSDSGYNIQKFGTMYHLM